jgi:hypothetical protein
MTTLSELMAGKKPTDAEIAAAPVIEQWRLRADVERGSYDMRGVMTGFDDLEERVVMLDVLYIDPQLGWFLIPHGYYGLGKRQGAGDE